MSRSNLFLGRLYQKLLRKMHILNHTFRLRPFLETSAQSNQSVMEPLEPRMLLSAVTEIDIDFTLTSNTNVSLVVEDSNGNTVRELLRSEAYEAGSHTYVWDGLDHAGEAVAAGNYTWKLLETGGLTSEFQFLLGTNPPDSQYREWVGEEIGVSSIAVADDGTLLLAAGNAENSKTMLRLTADGSSRFGNGEGQDFIKEFKSAGIGKLDGGGQRLFGLAVNDGNYFIRRYFDDSLINADSTNKSSGELKVNGYAPTDMDVRDNVIGLVYGDSGLVRLFDVDDYTELASTTIAGAKGITISGDGTTDTIYISKDNGDIVTITQSNLTPTNHITSNLTTPGVMDLDHSNNDLYVWDGGTGQIKRFDSSGTLLNTYGTSGGRAFGNYVDTDFTGVTDLAVNADGDLWVAETSAPMRVVLIDTDNGNIKTNTSGEQLEWFGGQRFFTNFAVNPSDSSEVWGDSRFGTIIQYDVDWANKTWDVAGVYETSNFGTDGLFPLRVPGAESASHYQVITIDNGSGSDTFLAFNRSPAWLRVDSASGELKAASLLGKAEQNGSGTNGYPQPWVDAALAAGYTTAEINNTNSDGSAVYSGTGVVPLHFSWVDTDGDGVMDASEFTFYTGVTVSPTSTDGDITENYDYVTTGLGSVAYYDLDRVGYGGPNGNIPTYAWTSVTAGPSVPTEFGSNFAEGVERTPDGQTFVSTRDITLSAPRWGHEVFSIENVSSRIGMFDANGNYQVGLGGTAWARGQEGSGLFYQNNQILGNTSISGDSERAVWFNDRIRQGPVVYTTDGLFIGTPLDNRANDGLSDTIYTYGADDYDVLQYDMKTGYVHQDSSTGDIYWFGPGQNDAVVYKITGFDTINASRQSGSLTVGSSVQEASLTGTGLKAFYYDDTTFGNLASTGSTGDLDMNWNWIKDLGGSGPFEIGPSGGLVSSSGLSQRLVGEIEAEFSEQYTFYADVNTGTGDAIRVMIDGVTIIDTITDGRAGSGSGSIFLRAGQQYDIVVESVYYTNLPALNISWTSVSQDRETIKSAHLYNGPVAAISLNDAAGATMADSSGYGNDAKFFNGERVNGISGTGLQFNGTDTFLAIPNDASLSLGSAATVSLWAKSDTANWNSGETLLAKGDAFRITQTASAKTIAFEVNTGSGWASASFTPTFDITQWHHYVGVFNGSTAKLYVDGAEVASVAASGELVANNSDVMMGRNGDASAYYDGALDDIKLYDRALDVAEVEDLYYKMADTPLVRTYAVDATASETGPQSGVIRVMRTGNSTSALTLPFTVTGEGVTSGDYESIGSSVTLAAGELYKDVVITPVLDGVQNEQPETVVIEINEGMGYTVSTASGTGAPIGVVIIDGDAMDQTETITADSAQDLADAGWVEIDNMPSTSGVSGGYSASNAAGGASSGEIVVDLNRWPDTQQSSGYVDTTLSYDNASRNYATLDDPLYASGQFIVTSYIGFDSTGRYIAGFLPNTPNQRDWTFGAGIGLRIDQDQIGVGITQKGALQTGTKIDLIDGLSTSTYLNKVIHFEYAWDPGTYTLSGTLTPDGEAAQTFSVTLTQAEYEQMSGLRFDRFGSQALGQHVWVTGTPNTGAHFQANLDDLNYGLKRDAAVNNVPVVSIEATDPDAREQGTDTGTYTVTRNGTSGDLTVNYTVTDSSTSVSTFSDEVNALGPAGYWRLNDDATDATAAGNNGTWTGTTSYVTGANLDQDSGQQSGSFNGSSYVTIANESDFDFERTDAFTYSAWVKTSSTTDGNFFSKRDINPGSGNGVFLRIQGGKFRAVLNRGGGEYSESTTASVNDGNWHLLTMTYDGSSSGAGLKLYIDGVEATTTNNGGNLGTGSLLNDAPVVIGAAKNGSEMITADIDEAAIFGAELTAQQVKDLYDASVNATGGASGDYTALSGSVTILNGQSSATITLTPNDDSEVEGDEPITVTLDPSANYILEESRESDIVVIADNDRYTVEITATDANASESESDTATFTIDRGAETTGDLTVQYTVGGTALGGDADLSPVSDALPVGYWRLNGDAQDSVSGGSDGTWTGTEAYASGTTINDEPGQQGASFDGSSYITASNESTFDFDRTDAFSYSAWVKTTASTSPANFLAKRDTTGIWNGVFLRVEEDGKFRAVLNYTGGEYSVETEAAVNDGNWRLLTMTYDGTGTGGVTLYIDGVAAAVTTSGALNSGTLLNDAPVVIGAAQGGSEKFTGDIDEASIYDSELTSAQVAEMYQSNISIVSVPGSDADYAALSGLVVIPDGQSTATITVTPIDDTVLESGESVVLTLAPTLFSVPGTIDSATATIGDNDSTINIAATDTDAAEAGPNTGTFTVTRDTTVGDLVVDYSVSGTATDALPYSNTVTDLNPVGYWRLNGNATDATAASNNGTWAGTETYVTGTAINGETDQKGASFNGSNYITLANESDFDYDRTDAFTYSAWVKTNTTTMSNFMAKRDINPGSGNGVFLRVEDDGKFRAVFNHGGGEYSVETTTAVNDGNWHLLTMTYDGTGTGGVTLYIDGVAASVTMSGGLTSGSLLNDAPVVIGAANNGSEKFTGDIDEVAIFGSELSSAQVSDLYTTASTGGGSDYQQLSGSVTILDGQSSATVTVTPIDDNEAEGDETVVLTVLDTSRYTLGTTISDTVTIADDATEVTITATDPVAGDANPVNTGTITVDRGSETSGDLTINYTVTGTADKAPPIYLDTVDELNPVAHWRLNGDATDSANTNDGTWTGSASYVTGTTIGNESGQQGASFNGGKYITAANESNFDFDRNDAFTYSAWVKTTSTTAGNFLAKRVTSGAWNGVFLRMESNGKFRAVLNYGGGEYSETTDTAINDGNWHLLTMTYDGSASGAGLKLYIDGVEASTTNNGGTLSTGSLLNDAPVVLGAAQNGSEKFTGDIDEVMIFDKELTAAETQNLYDITVAGVLLDEAPYTTAVKGLNPDGYWKLSDNADDSSGNGNNGTWSGTPTYTAGAPIDFESSRGIDAGGSRYITIANESNFDYDRTDAFSYSAWVKTTNSNAGNFLAKRNTSGSNWNGIFLRVDGGQFRAVLNHGSGEYSKTTTSTINDGNWHLLTMTYDGSASGSGLKLYIDGTEATTTNNSGSLSTGSLLNDAPVVVGGAMNGSEIFAGSVDEAFIIGSELTSTQISDLYNEATNATLPAGDYQVLSGSVTIANGQSSATIDITPIADALAECSETVTVTLDAPTDEDESYIIKGSDNASVTIYDSVDTVTLTSGDNLASEGGSNTASLTFTRTGTSGDLTLNVQTTGSAESGLSYSTVLGDMNPAGYWRLNNNALDETSGNSDGTWTGTSSYVTGASLSGETGQQGASFDGNKYITLSNESNFDFERTDAFTYSAWVKTNSTTDANFFAKRDVNPGSGNGVFLRVQGGKFRAVLNHGSGEYSETTTQSVNDGNWHLLTMTYDGSASGAGLKLYVDGVEATTTNNGGSLASGSLLNDAEVVIGAAQNGSEKFTGDIDEAAIFGSELTATQVQYLYNTAANGGGDLSQSSAFVIPDGQSSLTVTLTANDDTDSEGFESATFTLLPSATAGYEVGVSDTATVVIEDNDSLASENFDSGTTSGGSGWVSNWTLNAGSGVLPTMTTSGNPLYGSHHLQLDGDGASATRSADLSSLSSATLSLSFSASNFAASDTAIIEVYDGTTWTTLYTISDGADTGSYTDLSVAVPTGALTSSFQVRITSNMTDPNAVLYIDLLSIH